MPPSPHRTSMSFWKPRVFSTRSVCRRAKFYRKASPICSDDRSAGRRTMCGAIMQTSATRPGPGTRPDGSSPRACPREGGGRVASGRAIPTGRLHRHQPEPSYRARRRLLQSARHGGATHQGRQERHQLDPVIVPWFPQQRGASSAARPGVQHGQLPQALALRAASKGRTHGSTRPACINVTITLANREPSTHG